MDAERFPRWNRRINFDKANCPSGDFCCGLAGVPGMSHCDCCGYMRCLQTSAGATCQAY